jgi:hypothetical protein
MYGAAQFRSFLIPGLRATHGSLNTTFNSNSCPPPLPVCLAMAMSAMSLPCLSMTVMTVHDTTRIVFRGGEGRRADYELM